MSTVAAGSYGYRLDGEVQPVTEPWVLSRDGAGLRLRGERRRHGRPLLRVDARFERARCVQLSVDWLAEGPRRFEYALQAGFVDWRSGDAAGAVAVPRGTLLFPLLRAATGPLLLVLARAPASVVVPSLHDPSSAQFLRPEATPRRAELCGDRYRYRGGEYGDDGCECALDERGFLTRYLWTSAQGTWDVRLEAFQAEPDFAFS